MKAKHLMTALLAAAIAVPVLYAAEEEPGKTPPPPVEQKEMKERPRPPMRGPRREAARPSKELLDAVKLYREKPTDENKAKVRSILEKEFDARIKREEDRIAEMKSRKAENIDRRMERLLKRGERRERPGRPGPEGPEKPRPPEK